jgi:hypothetical protein
LKEETMRKRLKKKLSLNRETLRNLEDNSLRKAAGGACTFEDLTTCVCTDACNSGGTGTGTGTGSGPHCPTITDVDLTCCGNC